MLNKNGEVADFLDTSQFAYGHSAYECVAYSAALIRYCGQPNTGPTGNASQIFDLAQYWYATEEGSNDQQNTNGMSLDAEYSMLSGIGLAYQQLEATIPSVFTSLQNGYPVMVCGVESSFYDMQIGDSVPYPWVPTGNHCIVASGISNDGNLLVHDTANISNGIVRPGPRIYDASKMQIVSATAVAAPWQGGFMLNIQNTHNHFSDVGGNVWKCNDNNNVIGHGILDYYRSLGSSPLFGLTILGLPTSNEIGVPGFSGCVIQMFERGAVAYDPSHIIDFPPGAGPVYQLHLNNSLVLQQLSQYIPQVMPDLNKIATDISQLQNDLNALLQKK